MANDDHQYIWAIEMASDEPTAWDHWIARLEKLIGHDLDGNSETDGYSLDECYDLFKAGKKPINALAIIRWRQNGLRKAY